jgi:hypothetical protein
VLRVEFAWSEKSCQVFFRAPGTSAWPSRPNLIVPMTGTPQTTAVAQVMFSVELQAGDSRSGERFSIKNIQTEGSLPVTLPELNAALKIQNLFAILFDCHHDRVLI